MAHDDNESTGRPKTPAVAGRTQQRLVIPDKPLEGELLPESPFKNGDLVTRTGADIQRVSELDGECYFGSFECLYDSGGIYDIGEVEGNMARRYQKITERDYPHLLEIARKRGFTRV